MIIQQVRNRFSNLSSFSCQLASVSLAQRLVPGYEEFSNKHNLPRHLSSLNQALLTAWNWLELQTIDPVSAKSVIVEVESLIPETSEYDDFEVSFGLDCACATQLALQSFIGDSINCLNDISVLSTDSVDRVIQQLLDIKTFNSATDESILTHPFMVKEIAAQSSLIDIVYPGLGRMDAVKRCKAFCEENKGSTALFNTRL
jgi:uncharacterized protein YjaG (DUF416 family)